MNLEVRTCRPEELGAALTPIWHYFGRSADDDSVGRVARVLPADRVHAAFADGAVVGGAGAYALEMTVPGAVVPTAGVMGVGVLPTHRRRGILTALMRRQLDDVRTWGEPLAMLYASEGAIYRRYGYGPASLQGEFELERARAAFYPPVQPAGVARIVAFEEALERFPPIYERVRRATPGMLARSREWWEVRRLSNPPWATGEQVRVVVELDGQAEAYAIYRIAFAAKNLMTESVLEIVEAIGATAAATREVWRYLLSIDWVETIRAGFLPVDHPLLLLLVEPRRLRFVLGEALWVRLVDVGTALSARGYAEDGRLVFEVEDAFCDWNAGRWQLEGGSARRTDAQPDLRLDVAALGTVYLGGFGFADLARAGRLAELTQGAVGRADAMFRADRRPWCPEIF